MNWREKYLNKITCVDCMVEMKELPDGCIDLVITSPPYYEKNIKGHNKKSSPLYGEFFVPFTKYKTEWFKEIHRILNQSGMVFLNLGFNASTGWKHPFNLIENNPFNTRDLIMWEKNNPEPNSMGGLTHSFEFIFIFHKTKKPMYRIKKGEYVKDVWQMNVEENRQSSYLSPVYHGAMFPLMLPKRIITIASDENDIVFDPFMGSGQTAIAAREMKRQFVGMDINEAYCQSTGERLKQEILM